MTRTLLSIACHAYGAAALVYLAQLVRPLPALAWTARGLVGGGLLLHGGALATLWTSQGSMPVGMAQGFSLLAFLWLAIFLGVDLRYRRPVMGAFVTPLAVAVLVPGLLIPGGGALMVEAAGRP